MNVSLTPRLEEIVRKKVESGLYNNASEVVREAICQMDERDQQLEKLRAAIAPGLDDLEQVRTVPWTDTLMDEIIAEVDTERAANAAKTSVASVSPAPHPSSSVGSQEYAEYTLVRWGRGAQTIYLAEPGSTPSQLRGQPEPGRSREDLGRGLRSFPCARYLVIYTVRGDEIGIVRILHQRMDAHRAVQE